MIYLYIDKNTIKKLALKKTILGQQETSFYQKTYETTFLDNGKPGNVDLLASGIKEVLIQSGDKTSGDNQVTLILPQNCFIFFRAEVPVDIAPPALESFINDKARTNLPIDSQGSLQSYFIQEVDGQKVVTFYALNKEIFSQLKQSFTLIDLKLVSIIPDTLAYFKLFEKTLRKEKKETILYLIWDKENLSGYLFDSFGLLKNNRYEYEVSGDQKLETVVKEKIELLSTEVGRKINRLIISGTGSEKIRQDTFTKSVGVWTNPLKRIVPTFYDDYLKMLVVGKEEAFPLLSLDVCFGAFIFSEENKGFSLLKGGNNMASTRKGLNLPKFRLPLKEILLFSASFILSFLAFNYVSKNKPQIKLPLSKPTATPTVPPPTVTPTPSYKKADLKIKVLNGAGTAGKATEVKNLLKNKGYQEIITGNADNYEYDKTAVEIKKEFSAVFSVLKEDLKDYVTLSTSSTLDDKDASDIIITIGADFK